MPGYFRGIGAESVPETGAWVVEYFSSTGQWWQLSIPCATKDDAQAAEKILRNEQDSHDEWRELNA